MLWYEADFEFFFFRITVLRDSVFTKESCVILKFALQLGVLEFIAYFFFLILKT